MSRNNIFKRVTVAAWISITVIAYATLTHVGFVYPIYFKLSPILMRPEMRNYAHFEHLISFAVVGVLFSFAYPRRTILVRCIVFDGAALLELFQTLTPDRHGTLADALEKMAGGAAAIFLARRMLHIGRQILDFVEQPRDFLQAGTTIRCTRRLGQEFTSQRQALQGRGRAISFVAGFASRKNDRLRPARVEPR
jgi:VanZ family protein